jgi:hypothetical protein
MKRLGLLISAILLTGCMSTAPIIPKWPDVPADLLESCPDLKTVDPTNNKLSTLLDTVADNYKEYYSCKDKVDDWVTWYKEQQKLWKTLK